MNEYNKKNVVNKYVVLACVLVAIITMCFVVLKYSSNWISRADNSVVTLYCYDFTDELVCTGSGFVFDDSRRIITNYHVIEDNFRVVVVTNNNVKYEVENVASYDVEKDIAILNLSENTGLSPLQCGKSSELKKGDKVIAIGSPEGVQNSVSEGIVSQFDNEYIQITAPISHGSSGGALFNGRGKVIGITTASNEDGQNLNYAIPIEEAEEVFKEQCNLTLGEVIAKEAPDIYSLINIYDDYGAWISLDIDELIENESIYVDKLILVKGYISSEKTLSIREGIKEMNYIVCSHPTLVSGEYEKDVEEIEGSHSNNWLSTCAWYSADYEKIPNGSSVMFIGKVQFYDKNSTNGYYLEPIATVGKEVIEAEPITQHDMVCALNGYQGSRKSFSEIMETHKQHYDEIINEEYWIQD